MAASCGGGGGGAAAPAPTPTPAAMPALASPPPQPATAAGGAVEITIANTGGDVTACSAPSAGAETSRLPAGLSVAVADAGGTRTCAITGTVDGAAAPGTYTVAITAASAAGPATVAVTIEVAAAAAMPALASPPPQPATAAGAAVEITIANTGGDVTACSAPSAGAETSRLPAGLSVAVADAGGAKTCAITGTVDGAAAPGTYTVAITAASAAGPVTVIVTLTVPAPPILASPPPQAVIPGSVVDLPIANTGGDVTACSAPSAGAETSRLPAGLSVAVADAGGAKTCAITGTVDGAAAPGTYTVAITAASAAGPVTVIVTLTVPAPPILASPPAQTVAPGSMVDLPIANAGGDVTACSAPSAGAETSRLPAGLSVAVVDAGGKRTCAITGTVDGAAAPGTYTVAITAASAAGPVTVIVTLTVPAPPILASPPAQTVAPGSMVDLPIANAGGDVTACSAPSAGAETSRLPAGLAVAVADAGGAKTCAITGTVDGAAAPGTYTVAITAASAAGPATVDVTLTVLPRALPVERAALGYTPPPQGSQSGTLTLDWGVAANADGYRVFRGLGDDPLEATELTEGQAAPISATSFADEGAEEGAAYHYWVQSCLGAVCSGFGEPISTVARIADADGDGLIEIATARDLHNVRHSLDGSRYRPEAGSPGSIIGCPEAGCTGYELVADIDFDSDGDGSTWSRRDDGSVGLDAGDRDSVHFDTEDGGWTPIGDCGADGMCYDYTSTDTDESADNQPFTATFDGGGHTIAGLATAGDHIAVGMFGLTGGGAEIRDLGLTGNLARYLGSSSGAVVGGLVGFQDGGSITASYATGPADGGAGDYDLVGGLVGWKDGGSITASWATGPADGGAGDYEFVGGLVGQQFGGSITASYATGPADGGAGVEDTVGGLVGHQSSGSITASHATGGADGGAGDYDRAGGLVGVQSRGSITASWATGPADGGAGDRDYVGGLVGLQSGGSITASHATGPADGGAGGLDLVGGLVGSQGSGSITASYATGDADGGAGGGGLVGGLVGYQGSGSITASYATGSADGGAGDDDRAGGLVGWQDGGSITASYATASADGGAGDSDNAGGLVGQQFGGSITASWGFGTVTGETTGHAGSDDRPAGVTQASQLASANAPASWSQASSNTLGAWDFGTASQTPALSYADYDGAAMGTAPDYTGGHIFHCAGDDAPVPDGAVVVPGCGTLIPGVVTAANVTVAMADITVISGTAGTAYIAVLADGALAPAAAAIKAASAGSGGVVAAGSSAVTAGARTTVSLTGLMGETAYNAYIVIESGGVLGAVMKVDLTILRVADADGDGLIEIGTLAELNNVRHSLDGTGYKTRAGATPNTRGCPNGVCRGYELTADLDFDADGDGSTWTRNSDGSVTLDAGDDNDAYFDIASDGSSGGWAPIGDCGADGSCFGSSDNRPFTATFDGGGHTIAGLAITGGHAAAGMFGLIGEGAEIRNLGLTGNLARYLGSSSAVVGGLVGRQDSGSITASYATGGADGGTGGGDYVGGLVGRQDGGSITASHATGDADGGAGGFNSVGGLVGYQTGGSITASHATGSADGGTGGGDRAGGLVGYQNGGSVTASRATGPADGGTGDGDEVGGLVGQLSGGSITASWATGDADGGAGDRDYVGGLVGQQFGGSITASHATGSADGGAGENDNAGGLVGLQFGGSITASYATGGADGGAGENDNAGGLVGLQLFGGSIAASWGFGAADGEFAGSAGSYDRPAGVGRAGDLSAANVPASWNEAASGTLGAWGFGTAQPPTLRYADYDGEAAGTAPDYTGGHLFHCADDDAPAPGGAAVIPGCGAARPAIPGQLPADEPPGVAFAYTGASGPQGPSLSLSWSGPEGADGWRVWRGADNDLSAAELVSGTAPLAAPALADGGVADGAAYHYWVAACFSGECRAPSTAFPVLAATVDADGDGLIEVSTLRQLHNVRFGLFGDRYRASAGGPASSGGCPGVACRGYELTADLDFDSDGDGGTWARASDGGVALDPGDDDDVHFDVDAGGWEPIGSASGFAAVFEGNGHTIAGLATARDLTYIGLFGRTSGAEIRNLGLTGNLARYAGSSRANVGGLVGWQEDGSITASHATGPAEGGAGRLDFVGGLVGLQHGGSITASYATGDADGGAGDDDRVGGLVGQQSGGSITASYATGDADGGAGDDDRVGGLVGWQFSGSITASYATGDADGGTGDDDRVGGLAGVQDDGSIAASYATGDADGGAGGFDFVGGLVGWQFSGSITASYATGDADGGTGDGDNAGGLVGRYRNGPITASWGFGEATGGTPGPAGSDDRPAGVTQARQLASANAPASWSQASSNTLGAWDFGTASQTPALSYADYDGAAMGTAPDYTGGHIFHCADDAASAPDGAALIPVCAPAPALIPGQRAPMPVERAALSYTPPPPGGQSGTLTLDWGEAANVDGYRVFRGGSGDPLEAAELTDGTMDPIAVTRFVDTNAADGATYYYWVQSCLGAVCSGFGEPIPTLARIADADGDGLIEIATARQLHNVRHSLDGSRYRPGAGSAGLASGCPEAGCSGYELVADIDFDSDGDGSTWSRGGDGSVELDAGDHDSVHFDTGGGGWAPIGDCGADGICADDATTTDTDESADNRPFAATFDGGGHTIAGLATAGDHSAAGMFGLIGEGAEIRNLGLTDNLAKYVGSSSAFVGGLVGFKDGGSIAASRATGDADGGAGENDSVGGLVGLQQGGSITASYATGDADGGAGDYDSVGGLVGYQEDGSITASYATGPADGGAGENDYAGGLVGWQEDGSITASYATGPADGGTGDRDFVGGLVGLQLGGPITASWGFGAATGGFTGSAGSYDRPAGVGRAGDLSAANVPASWNEAASGTLGAWGFGTAQPPVVRYADYDGAAAGTAPDYAGGHLFHCAGDAAPAPEGAILITGCGAARPAIPGQLPANEPPGVAFAYTGASGPQGPSLSLSWSGPEGADGWRVWRGADDDLSAAELVSGTAPLAAPALADGGVADGAAYHYWVAACFSGECRAPSTAFPVLAATVDADGDGLIEVSTLRQLHNVRFGLFGDRYRASAGGPASSGGCPGVACRGYELTADLDFDSDGDGGTWARASDGGVALDPGDDDDVHFDVDAGGWEPIGGINVFTAVFEGNGHTIAGLATARDLGFIGLFGRTSGAEIRNLGLTGNLARYAGSSRANVGGLVGWQEDGSITASYATGPAEGGTGDLDIVGGLVGGQGGGSITASHATGPADGGTGDRDYVGGLVGYQSGTITASYATGPSDGGAGGFDLVGGLVGLQGGSITASYATGPADGGAGESDNAGGLVGYQSGGSITASYATGPADGGAGGFDNAGGLVGDQYAGSIAASWGFGTATGGTGGIAGSDDRPAGVTQARQLASANAPASWSQASSNTLGAWDFGTASQTPALSYADYDGAAMGTAPDYTGGHIFHCADDDAPAPEGAAVIPGCGAADRLIPGQRRPMPVERAALSYTPPPQGGQSGTLTLDWGEAANVDGYRVFRGGSGDPLEAAELTDGTMEPIFATRFVDTNADDGAAHHYWVRSCLGAVCSGFGEPISTLTLARMADADSDGLIEIATARELHNVRHSLDGSRYRPEAGSVGSIIGCPEAGCAGYELVADIDFDSDGDGSTWSRGGDGSAELDAGDHDSVHFDTGAGGWAPIGDCGADLDCDHRSVDNRPFAATFDGNGHTIAGLATAGDHLTVGMFGLIGEGAEIRNLGLTGNLARYAGSSSAVVGGLVGSQNGGSITASHATGPADGGAGGFDRVGGLVGSQNGGSITASYATGPADGGAGHNDNVGGLVGEHSRGSITASHATGPADGGAGNRDDVGGLVGSQGNGSITASHATGDADGGEGDSDEVGGLVGHQGSGSITASHATGDADGGAGNSDNAGALVGLQSGGSITASHATGDADGGEGDSDEVGGLVGHQGGGSITASWATGSADGGAGFYDSVGGLVGHQPGGSIAASYATGPADGGEGDSDEVGGLVGHQGGGSITASYATGPADGGAGNSDNAGALVGLQSGGSITASWGFGTPTGGTAGRAGSGDRPAGVTQASQLASANVPASWSQASSNTLGAWDFGTASQAPALSYADYDGAAMGTAPDYTGGHRFHCAGDDAPAPDGAALIPGCAAGPALIPGQRMAQPVGQAAPILASPPAQTVAPGSAVDLAIANTGGDVTACSAAPPLPAGLAVGPADAGGARTCTITGTVDSAAEPGTHTVVITAENAAGSDTAVVTFFISGQPPNLANPAPQTVTPGSAVDLAIANTGGDVTACSAAPPLPAGLAVAPADAGGARTCAITGTVDSAAEPGTHTVVIAAENAAGSATAVVTFFISGRLPILASPSAQTWAPGSAVNLAIANTGGDVAAIGGCAVTAGNLPAGLDVAPADAGGARTCAITGTVDSAAEPGTHTVVITATNAWGQATVNVTFLISGRPPNLASPSAQTWAPGSAVDLPIANTGGDVAAVGGCAVTAGILPAGLAVGVADAGGARTCAITGTVDSAAEPGTRTVVITAANAWGQATVNVTFFIPGQPPNLASPSAQTVAPGSAVDLPIANTGGDVTACSAAPPLPAGLAVGVADAGGARTCAITGTVDSAAEPGTHTVVITAENAEGSDTADVTFFISGQPPNLASPSAQTVAPGSAVDLPIANTGGDVTACSAAPPLPAGLAVGVADAGGARTCAITGTVDSAAEPGTHTVVITAENAAGSDTADVTFFIPGQPPNLASPAPQTVAPGSAVNLPIANAGGDVMFCSAPASGPATSRLPAGLAVALADAGGARTCAITGTVDSAAEPGTHTVTITAENTEGSDTGVVTLTVLPRALPVESAELGYTAPAGPGQRGTLTLDWEPALNADGYRVFRGGSDDPMEAVELTDPPISATIYADDGVADGAAYYYWVQSCLGSMCSGFGDPISTLASIADADGDGLIEIATARQLHSVRFDLAGTSRRAEAGGPNSSRGCPVAGCFGYELVANIDFDSDGDGSTWSRGEDGSVELDAGDRDSVHFDTEDGGWAPIGDCGADGSCSGSTDNRPFAAVFDGGGHTIAGLATAGDHAAVGMFGLIGEGAEIRNLALTGNLARYVGSSRADVGGLVGHQVGGSITASHATGPADGGAGNDDSVGGLVGYLEAGSITASWVTGPADGGAGDSDDVGGLVGQQSAGSITASYATGSADGGAGGSDYVGGLVGRQSAGSITASYATGPADGGAGNIDNAGGLVGQQSAGSITASWGFGTPTGGTAGPAGSDDRPAGVTQASQLASANAPASWNQASSSTLGAWDFGTASQAPALNYADYDGAAMGTAPDYTGGHTFHCAGDAAPAPDGAIFVPGCAAGPALIPGQRMAQPVGQAAPGPAPAPATGARRGEAATAWAAARGSAALRPPPPAPPPPLAAPAGAGGPDAPADADGDGLIEVSTLRQLHNVRFDLAGASRRDRAGGPGSSLAMWSEDESEVYFVRGFGESQELFVVDASGDGGERFVMNMAPLFPLGPFYDVTADGAIVWVRYEKQKADIWVARLDNGD